MSVVPSFSRLVIVSLNSVKTGCLVLSQSQRNNPSSEPIQRIEPIRRSVLTWETAKSRCVGLPPASTLGQINIPFAPIKSESPQFSNLLTEPVTTSTCCGTPCRGLSQRKTPKSDPIHKVFPTRCKTWTGPVCTATDSGIPLCQSSHLYNPFDVPIHRVLSSAIIAFTAPMLASIRKSSSEATTDWVPIRSVSNRTSLREQILKRNGINLESTLDISCAIFVFARSDYLGGQLWLITNRTLMTPPEKSNGAFLATPESG